MRTAPSSTIHQLLINHSSHTQGCICEEGKVVWRKQVYLQTKLISEEMAYASIANLRTGILFSLEREICCSFQYVYYSDNAIYTYN